MFLLEWDFELFYYINTVWTHPWLDAILPFWRNKYIWAPLYLFFITFCILNFSRKGLWIVLCFLTTVGVSDFTSSKIVKPTIKRHRPCNDTQIKKYVRPVIKCGGGYSFTSSHATNHFAMAAFVIVLFGRRYRWLKALLGFWAFSISYGQVYVGVHYPLDIFGGALLGIVIGTFIGRFARNYITLEFLYPSSEKVKVA